MEINEVSLKEYSSLSIGGKGMLAHARNIKELQDVIKEAKARNLKVHIIGQGTNSYFGEDLDGYLFVTFQLLGIEVISKIGTQVKVRAHASEIWDDLVIFCVEHEYWGVENLSYIPGTVGAAPVQNIGAYGADISKVLESVEVLDMETGEMSIILNSGCGFGYRDSVFKKNKGKYIITSIVLELSLLRTPNLSYKPLDTLSKDVSIDDIRNCVIRTRTLKLPDYNLYPNAGSFFKNPVVEKGHANKLKDQFENIPLIPTGEEYKVPAAWLIENIANMKGVKIGNVGASPTQPLVLVNYDSATADEIDEFARKIKDDIFLATGILLEQEVNRVG